MDMPASPRRPGCYKAAMCRGKNALPNPERQQAHLDHPQHLENCTDRITLARIKDLKDGHSGCYSEPEMLPSLRRGPTVCQARIANLVFAVSYGNAWIALSETLALPFGTSSYSPANKVDLGLDLGELWDLRPFIIGGIVHAVGLRCGFPIEKGVWTSFRRFGSHGFVGVLLSPSFLILTGARLRDATATMVLLLNPFNGLADNKYQRNYGPHHTPTSLPIIHSFQNPRTPWISGKSILHGGIEKINGRVRSWFSTVGKISFHRRHGDSDVFISY
ncbi:uncharacterized protein BO97DRAFT_412537 [Aspergillus homomorphus CBS 101889]|uniref:Uncharacterized protein n=1 Tax=Aspergillus homomorphus (strain CBS 101889) TaxID=1450537 RepID=A0A395I4R0_ASPHC|nr:hypothetical protein BO97DRAFT_412537 [Aspergillus homomorphus CBS 101889]RAL14736.1 hypothetical protein BO97DRAFT_412537 [Aspergillus homomorphus CBS 101889]